MTRLTHEQLRQLAVTTLNQNRWQERTVPSHTLYPHQWSWDAGFIAIGLGRFAPAHAWADLRALFRAQWADGRVPHIAFDPVDGERPYFPGPQFWRTTGVPAAAAQPTSGIIQPPVHALAAWEVYRQATDRAAREAATDQLRWLYPRLVAQQRYLARHRDVGGAGLACLVHPWESGQDNSPAWDEPLAAVPVDPALANGRRRDLAVSIASHRPTDADYARYIYIAQAYRGYGYVDDGPGERYPFLVECPTFNAVYAGAEHALADIAIVIGADPAPHREQAMRITQVLAERLYDPDTGLFHALDLYTGRLSPPRCLGGLIPLILPDLPPAQVKTVLAEATSPRFGLSEQMTLPLPSYDRTADDFDQERYWRGPIWVNMNWLLWRGLREHGSPALAAALRRATIDLVRDAGCFEYFHPVTGAGIGAGVFSWTAALVLDLLDTPDLLEASDLPEASDRSDLPEFAGQSPHR